MKEIEIQNVDGVKIILAPAALQLRDGLLAEARAITSIPDAEAEKTAVAIVGRMNGFAKDLEACRKAVKKPVLELGKKIDAIAEEALDPLAVEKNRVTGLLVEIETARQRERDRIQAEADKKIGSLKTPAAQERVAVAAKEKLAEVGETKVKGTIGRTVYNVEVLDVKAVYAWNPLYVKLVPDLPMLKLAASRGQEIPGCRITKEVQVSVRAS